MLIFIGSDLIKNNLTMANRFSLKEDSSGMFRIVQDNGSELQNHRQKIYPPLSEPIANALCTDFNEIFTAENNVEADQFNDLLRNSFGYCVISTMMHANERSFELDIETSVQWDQVFRLNPGPPLLLSELSVLEKPKEQLKSEWVNLTLNYSSSIEEMKENEDEFVPEEIIQELNSIIREFQPAELFTVELLTHYFRFGITIPILWIAGKIDDETLVKVYSVFTHQLDPDDWSAGFEAQMNFTCDRLRYLKLILEGYRKGDASLPV